MAEQAKCDSCRIRYLWEGSIPLKGSKCPKCGAPLKGATHRCNYPVLYIRIRDRFSGRFKSFPDCIEAIQQAAEKEAAR